MKTFTHAMMVAAMAVAGTATAQAAGPVDFGPLPGTFGTAGAGCVGGNCPTGNCRNGECGLGGCPNGMCATGNRYGQYGYQPLNSQTAYAGSNRPLANAAYYGTAARSTCPGGVCPQTQAYTAGYAPRVPVAGCTTGNCPTAVPRYPVYQQPRFSFLGFRF
jgi:hypothetical protein